MRVLRRSLPAFLFSVLPFVASLFTASLATGPFAQAAPELRSPTPLTSLAFTSCLKQGEPAPLLQHLSENAPELTLFLGDTIYYTGSSEAERVSAYRSQFSRPELKSLWKRSRVFSVWDDNDYGAVDGGREYTEKNRSKESFLTAWRVPRSDERWKRDGIYFSKFIGPPDRRVQLIFLDTRTFRSPLTKGEARPGFGPYIPGSSGEILGETQWRWLTETVKAPAAFRIIVSSIQVLSEGHGYECWGNFPDERKRLLALLSGETPTVLVSGDRHQGEFSKLPNSPLWDLTTGGLNRVRTPGPEENPLRVGPRTLEANYGVLELHWGADRLEEVIAKRIGLSGVLQQEIIFQRSTERTPSSLTPKTAR